MSNNAVSGPPKGWESQVVDRVPSEDVDPSDPGHTYHLLADGQAVSTSTPKLLSASKSQSARAQINQGKSALRELRSLYEKEQKFRLSSEFDVWAREAPTGDPRRKARKDFDLRLRKLRDDLDDFKIGNKKAVSRLQQEKPFFTKFRQDFYGPLALQSTSKMDAERTDPNNRPRESPQEWDKNGPELTSETPMDGLEDANAKGYKDPWKADITPQQVRQMQQKLVQSYEQLGKIWAVEKKKVYDSANNPTKALEDAIASAELSAGLNVAIWLSWVGGPSLHKLTGIAAAIIKGLKAAKDKDAGGVGKRGSRTRGRSGGRSSRDWHSLSG
ncbi:MAG: hypothetical protein CMH53_10345 [Myxococcales bacterium]|nr:hypothetical protein [Myxococcales bacterium]